MPDEHLVSNAHRAMMVLGSLAALGLAAGLAGGWYDYANRQAKRRLLARMELARMEKGRREHPAAAGQDTHVADASIPPQAVPEAKPAASETTRDLLQAQQEGELPAMPQREPIAAPLEPARLSDARSLVEDFRHARTWSEKKAFVRDPERVGDSMRLYYEVWHSGDPPADDMLGYERFRLDGREILALSYRSSQPAKQLEVLLLPVAHGGYQLDWESFVGWGELPFQELKKRLPAQPHTLRLYVRADPSYKGPHGESAGDTALELISPDGLYYLHGWCTRGSQAATALGRLAREFTLPARLTLRVAYAADAGPDDPVIILGVLADGWFR